MLHINLITGSRLALLQLLFMLPSVLKAAPARPVHSLAADSFQTVIASARYQKSRVHEWFWGKHYRPVWKVPVQARVLDLSQEAGGLKPLQQGGSFQTKNLRLVNPAGKEYVLRSIDKDPTKALSEKWRKTFIANLLQDQTSVIHPYGALIVPVLAEAAGIYHTIPQLVVVPDDPALGEFRQEFAGMVALLEERPEGDQREVPHFGHSPNVVSSRKLFEALLSHPCNQVDRRHYLRSRLFDMWLGDWSRREDQWRWASFPQADRTVYKAIPRDRDHAFFKFNDGLLTWLASLVKPKYQSFRKNFGQVSGLNKSAYPMDAYFLAGLSLEDFLQTAYSLQKQLTDEVIRQATHTWPEPVYALSGREFEEKLIARRRQLPQVAGQYYRLLARKPILPGTDDKERFVVQRLNARQTKVSIYADSDSSCARLPLFERTFTRPETHTIYLYGLGGKDSFDLSGEVRKGSKISLYDGAGTDQIRDSSLVHTWGRKTAIYDSGDGNDIKAGKRTRTILYKPLANEYTGEGWLLRHRLD